MILNQIQIAWCILSQYCCMISGTMMTAHHRYWIWTRVHIACSILSQYWSANSGTMMTAHHSLWLWTRLRSPDVFFPNTDVWFLELWWPLIIGIEFEPESRSPVVFFPNTGVRILELWWPLIIGCDFEPDSDRLKYSFPILPYEFWNYDDRSS